MSASFFIHAPGGRFFRTGILLACLGLTAAASAQSKPGSRAEAWRDALGRATELFTQQKDDQAETVLAGISSARSGTAQSHLATAQQLLLLAVDFSNRGETELADRAAQRALRRAGVAVAQSGPEETDLKGSALELQGLIQENFSGDWEQARASYRAAAELASDRSAQGRLERLERMDSQRLTKD